jgi:hypothetical protein
VENRNSKGAEKSRLWPKHENDYIGGSLQESLLIATWLKMKMGFYESPLEPNKRCLPISLFRHSDHSGIRMISI